MSRYKYDISFFKEKAKELEGECLSEIYSNKIKLKWKCKKGHIWESKASNILDRCWCPFCFNEKRKKERSRVLPNDILGAKWIALTQNQFALVDEEDYKRVNVHSWAYYKDPKGSKNLHYAKGKVFGKHAKMHRFILNIKDSKIYVDHVNGNGLDNRKHNLRLGTSSQNQINRGLQKNNTSGYKGVCWLTNCYKWQSSITVKKHRIVLGYYESKHEAAKAYNKAAIKYFGGFARLNIIIDE